MSWLGISGVVLFVAGVLAPEFGLILERDFSRASFVLCAVGLAAFGVAGLLRRRRANDSDISNSADGGDAATDFGSHHSHEGGHGDDGGDGGH